MILLYVVLAIGISYISKDEVYEMKMDAFMQEEYIYIENNYDNVSEEKMAFYSSQFAVLTTYDCTNNEIIYSTTMQEGERFYADGMQDESIKLLSELSSSSYKNINIIKKADSSYQEIASLVGGNNWYYVFIVNHGDDVFSLFKFPEPSTFSTWDTALSYVIVISIASIPIFLLLAFAFSRMFISPIRSLYDITNDYKRRDFSKRAQIRSKNEIGFLTESINEMADSLESYICDADNLNNQLNKTLEQQRLNDEAQKEFISNISHEIKTPLSIISGYAECMEYGLIDSPADTVEYARIIQTECERINNLVLDFISINSSNTQRNSVIALNDVIGDVLRNLNSIESKSLITSSDITPGASIHSNYNNVYSVISNILKNAYLYTPEGGRIHTSLTEVTPGAQYQFSVLNDIDKENVPDERKLWDRFYKGDASRSKNKDSTGIGLSIVKKISDENNWDVGASISGEEIVFCINFK